MVNTRLDIIRMLKQYPISNPTNGGKIMSILLSAQERDRFASWLEQEAKTDEEMSKQLEAAQLPKVDLATGIPGNTSVMVALSRKYKAEALAARVIAKKLRSIEEETIG